MLGRIEQLRDEAREVVLSIPEAVRACRKGRKTQDELAVATGFGQSTLSQWENGRSMPDLDQLRAIEEACGRPRGWIALQAGYVAGLTKIEDAIAMSPDLDDVGRDIVLKVYRANAKRRV